ncbi:alpha-D-ribose 1-methylphosphonate 5-triphosphate diphosphatase [Shimia haliotis]|uniref:Alpha-D-ribose 1-methylphosphonate 5-triphosphate diphosphatase n=1 Tax=Shimia haliotis TaxID=1280847 RepID=A0A1I4DW39_9RHOB|nr:alpha-D-ribose 1-methylphosphonate 5-triphosphate diphosphatase [Shimia haliotis]SFK97179.1 alpha-D-ribose 1-methylphosphonate 5-triphosphate diphosphatase [Shimia haliotis]
MFGTVFGQAMTATRRMNEWRLTGADVLRAEGFSDHPVSVRDGHIVDQGGREIDLRGFCVLPGIVDLHGDGFERHLAPRRGAMKDLGPGLAATDAELAANGITTAVLAQFWSWEGGMRGPEFARRFLAALDAADGMLTDVLVQLRLETHMLDDYADFEAAVSAHDVPYVVFNDHLPHKALAKGKKPPRLTGQALKAGRNPETHEALLKAMYARKSEVPEAVSALAARLAMRQVRLGSHDDNTVEQRARWRGCGALISEFPETREAAEAARAGGDAIVLGAPNVVRGNSHKGNVSAGDLVADGLCDALASDYHYPAMKQAVLRLAADGVVSLEDGWRLISSGPAAVLGLEDRGEIEVGKRADMLVMDANTGRVDATLVGGRVSFMAGEVAARFMG